MKKQNILAFLLSLTLLSSCGDKKEETQVVDDTTAATESSASEDVSKTTEQNIDNEWVDAVATISVTSSNDGEHSYSISYEVTESSAVDSKGNAVKGPIIQHSSSKNKPVNGQTVKIQYLKDEPIMFKYVDQIKFESN